MAISNSTDRFNGVVASLAIKVRCVVGVTVNVPALTGISNPYDGVFVVEGDRMLLTAQNNPIDNGIWVVNATGIWARAADWDGSRDVQKGSTVWAGRSGGQSDRLWQVTNPAGVIQPGTTAVTITELMDPDLVGQNNPIVLAELANAGPDALGFGQIWVRNDGPNVLMFTDDLGTDFVLSVPAATDLESVTTIGNTTTQGIDVTFGSQLRVFNLVADANLTIDVTNVGGPVNMVANSALIMTSAGNMDLGFPIAGFLNFNPGGNNVMSLTNNICRVNTDSGGFFQIRDDIGSTLNCTMTTSGPNYIAAAIVGGDPTRYLFQPVSGGEGMSFQMAEMSAAPASFGGYGQVWVSPGAAGDPLWAGVVLLADMDGADAAVSYTEISPNTAIMGFTGNAQLDTAQFNSGTASVLLDGVGDQTTFPDIPAYNLGTGDWTIEFFVRLNSLPPQDLGATSNPNYTPFAMWGAALGDQVIAFTFGHDFFGTKILIRYNGTSENTGDFIYNINTWYHCAITRTGGNVRLYFDGSYRVGDFGGAPLDMGQSSEGIRIGSIDGVTAASFFDGAVDDVRITIGTARYTGTGAYAVPATPFGQAPSPNNFIFTDNLGVDHVLSATAAVNNTKLIFNTTDVLETIGAGFLRMYASISKATAFVAADVFNDFISFTDDDASHIAGQFGFSGGSTFDWRSDVQGGGMRVRGTKTGGGLSTQIFVAPDAEVTLGHNGGTRFATHLGGVLIGQSALSIGGIYMWEQAAAGADAVGQGQLWVNSVSNPNELMFTDETGNDINLVTDLWNNGVRQVVSDPLGARIRDTLYVGDPLGGVIKINELASPDADEANFGQIWVRNDALNTLMFTNDAGTDFIVGGSPTGTYTRNAVVVEDRVLLASASATAINNNNVLAALIADLTTRGIIG